MLCRVLFFENPCSIFPVEILAGDSLEEIEGRVTRVAFLMIDYAEM